MHIRPLHNHDYHRSIKLLRVLRIEQGVSQVQLAERLGITQSIISKVERCERRIDITELRMICLALGISFKDFVDRLEEALSGHSIESNSKEDSE